MAIGDIKKGRLFVLKAGDGATSEVFTTIAKLRTTSFDINGTEVDGTTKDDNGYKNLVSGAGTVSMSIGGSGIFDGSAQQTLMESRCLARSIDNYQLVFDGGRTYEVAAQVVSVSYEGTHDGEHTYNIQMSVSGQPTITPEA